MYSVIMKLLNPTLEPTQVQRCKVIGSEQMERKKLKLVRSDESNKIKMTTRERRMTSKMGKVYKSNLDF